MSPPRSRRLSRLSIHTPGDTGPPLLHPPLQSPPHLTLLPPTELSKASSPHQTSFCSLPIHLSALDRSLSSSPRSVPFRPTTAYSRSAGGHRPMMTSTVSTTVGCGGLPVRPSSSTAPRGRPRRCAVRAQGTFAPVPQIRGGLQFLPSPH